VELLLLHLLRHLLPNLLQNQPEVVNQKPLPLQRHLLLLLQPLLLLHFLPTLNLEFQKLLGYTASLMRHVKNYFYSLGLQIRANKATFYCSESYNVLNGEVGIN
jgi:hypothetical protein